MWTRILRALALALVAVASFLTTNQAWGIGFILGQSKDELKLRYDVTVQDHGTGRITVVLTLADEGRLKPLDAVELVIPAQRKNKDGSYWTDLSVSIEMRKTDDGKRLARVHIRKDLAERAEIHLNTHTMDGKRDPLTRLHHVIPIVKYMKNAPAAPPRVQRQPDSAATAPPATERRD